ncbi:MAG: glycine cleavage system protein GcvH [Planctomyces sp.]|nr:glycine cleavage system protein GcvH [Planctomyces sp.]
MIPADLRFAKTHEWVRIQGDVARVGISDFAVKELTDLVYIDLPADGRAVQVGDAFGEVESVKAVSDLYAPVAGTITAVNSELPGNLQWLSEDPYGKGWIAEIQLSDPAQAQALMAADAYKKFCDSEQH